MKKLSILFAIICVFVLQLGVVNAVDEKNVDLDEPTYNNMNTEFASCGNNMMKDVPISIPKTVHIAYTALQIVVPVILVVMGMITLIKAIISSKEDEIKKAQMNFVKKLIVGALIFFVFVIVKLLVSVAGDSGKTPNIIDCANCFLNGTDNCKITNKKNK